MSGRPAGRVTRSPAVRRRGGAGLAALAAAAALAGGCASRVEVRSLATGRSDISAYELRGSALPALQASAQRLCPQGGEILQQAQRAAVTEPESGALGRWVRAIGDSLEPPPRGAQLLLLCRGADMPAVGGATLGPAGAASAAAAAPAASGQAASGQTAAAAASAAGLAASVRVSVPVPVPVPTPTAAAVGAAPASAVPARVPKALPVGPVAVEW